MSPEINYPLVSITISTRNRCHILKRCLDSIATLDYPKDLLELIVLDDVSTDSTAQEIPEYLRNLEKQGFQRTLFLRNQENLGVAAGRRICGQKASPHSEMIFSIDDDAYLEPDCLKALVKYMREHPEVGIIAPRIVFAKYPGKTAHQANFVSHWTARYWSRESSEPISCDWVLSTSFLIRKEVLEKTGGFYPGYYTCHEEVDLCLRAKKAGFQVVYYPGVKVQHEEEIMQVKRDRLYLLYRNKLLLIHRNFNFFQKIVAMAFILLLGLPKYLLESIKFHKKFEFSELGLIFLSVWHGILGRSGRREKAG